MNINIIKSLILQRLSVKEVYVSLQDNHYRVIVVDEMFHDLNKLERHKIIYAPIMQLILDNVIHSVSVQGFTPEEWNIIK